MAEYAVDPRVDGAILGVSVAWVLTAELVEFGEPEAIDTRGRVDLGLDQSVAEYLQLRWLLRDTEGITAAATASDVIALATVAAPAAYVGLAVLRAGPAEASITPLAHAVIGLEGGMVALAVAEGFKLGVGAARPYVAACGDEPDCYAAMGVLDEVVLSDDGERVVAMTQEARASFYSGHASLVAGTSFALAHVIATEGEPSVPRAVLAYGVAAGLTTSVAVLRVEAARHYPSDVIAGSVIGAGIGLTLAELHQPSRRLRIVPAAGGAALTGTF